MGKVTSQPAHPRPALLSPPSFPASLISTTRTALTMLRKPSSGPWVSILQPSCSLPTLLVQGDLKPPLPASPEVHCQFLSSVCFSTSTACLLLLRYSRAAGLSKQKICSVGDSWTHRHVFNSISLLYPHAQATGTRPQAHSAFAARGLLLLPPPSRLLRVAKEERFGGNPKCL